MQNSTPRISDAEAAELWKRAAELQQAAEREASDRQLAPGERDDRLSLAGVTTSMAGVGGSWAGWSLGALVAGVFGAAATPLLLVPAGIGALVGGTLGLGGYRAMYRGFQKSGSATVQGFVAAVAAEAEMDAESAPPTT